MTPEEIEADEAQFREMREQAFHKARPLTVDAICRKPVRPVDLSAIGRLSHFTAREEDCQEMTRDRKRNPGSLAEINEYRREFLAAFPNTNPD